MCCRENLFNEQLKNLTQKIPIGQNSDSIRSVAEKRVALLRGWLFENHFDGIVITRRDNFAWLTCGGQNNVLLRSEEGTAHILITQKEQYLLAYNMDADRILDEQIPGQQYCPVVIRWYEGDPREKASDLVKRQNCIRHGLWRLD